MEKWAIPSDVQHVINASMVLVSGPQLWSRYQTLSRIHLETYQAEIKADQGAWRGNCPPQIRVPGGGIAPLRSGCLEGELPPSDQGAWRGNCPPQIRVPGGGIAPLRSGCLEEELPPSDQGAWRGNCPPQIRVPGGGIAPLRSGCLEGELPHSDQGAWRGNCPPAK